MQNDLFGAPLSDDTAMAKVRRRASGRGWRGGYASAPGSGPAGETCKTCDHYCRVGGGRRAYPKCGLMRHAWTHGPGSDIKARAPACSQWREPLDAPVDL